MRNRSLISAILLFAVTLGTFSCGGHGDVSDSSSDGQTDSSAPEETKLSDTLEKKNYSGTVFNIYMPSQHDYEFSEEQTGERVDDAEYSRDRKVEELLGVKLNYITEPGDWAGKDTFNGRIKQSVMAGDGEYDLVDGMIAVTNMIVPDGVFLNLMEQDGLDFDDPWWAKDMDENLSVAGKLYGICGAGLLSMYKSSYIIYYNQKLIDDFGLENPIDLVLDGKWTLEKMMSMTKDITTDLDSDGKYTENDRYGLALDNVNMRGFQSSLELPVISKNKNGELEYIGFTERFANAVDTWVSLSGDKKMVWCTGGDDDQRDARVRMFKADQTLFAGETILEVEDFRDMASDFGMIPQPKYDENQQNYHVQIGTGSGMYFIPKTVKNPEMTIDVMNAINCISMETVVPAYYEYALKEKFMRDEKNKEVIDIINSSMMMDVNFAFASTMGVNSNTIYVEIVNSRSDPASTFEKGKKRFEAGIEKLTATFEGLE